MLPRRAYGVHRVLTIAAASVLAACSSTSPSDPGVFGGARAGANANANANESADAGASNANGDAAAGDIPPPITDLGGGDDAGPGGVPARRVFVTSATFTGDLAHEGAAASALDGADELCAQAADAVGLLGTFRAWLSSGEGNAVDRVTGPGPWKMLDGRVVFPDRESLTHGSPENPLEIDEHGRVVHDSVWTGTSPDGTHAGVSCRNWTTTSAPFAGEFGHSYDVDQSWTYAAPVTQLPILGGVITGGGCGSRFHLYCFEQ